VFLNGSFYAALMLTPALLIAARGFLRWPFAASWWAFTFPLDALASAAGRYARLHPELLWRTVAGAALLLAAFFIAVTGYRTLAALSRATLLGAPAPKLP
jgi:tellurite resistance protein